MALYLQEVPSYLRVSPEDVEAAETAQAEQEAADRQRQLEILLQPPPEDMSIYEELDPEPEGLFEATRKGVLQGVLEPFSIIPEVDEFIGRELTVVGRPKAEAVGNFMGFMAGFLVPSTLALKFSSGALKAGRIVKTADAFANLGWRRNLARGALAGGMLGAGSSEELSDVPLNTALGAVFGGAGDMVAYPLMNAIAKGGRGASGYVRSRMVKAVTDRGVKDSELAGIYGRMLSQADDLYPQQTGAAYSVGSRYARLKEGIGRLDLDNLQPGEVRIIHGLSKEAKDLERIVGHYPELEMGKVVRGTKKKPMTDVLVARKGELDQRMLAIYKKNAEIDGIPWVPGQRVRWGSKDRIIVGRAPGKGRVLVIRPGADVKPNSVALKEIIPYKMIDWHLGPRNVKNAAGLWTQWTEKHGLYPADDWYKLFDEFVEDLPQTLNSTQKASLSGFFERRQINSILESNQELKAVYKKLGLQNPHKVIHPEGDLAALASQNGYIVDATIDEDGIAWFLLKDVRPGQDVGSIHRFTSAEYAVKFLQNQGARDLPSLPLGMGIPYNHSALEFGTPVQVAHAALTKQGINMPAWMHFAKLMLPRMQFVRFAEDIIIEATGKPSGLYKVMFDMQQAMTASRNAQIPWMDRIAKIRGGFGIFSNVRHEKAPMLSELLETPRKHWSEVIERSGFNKREVKAAEELRELFNDLFKFLSDPEVSMINLTGDDFLENYWPHIRRKMGSNWEEMLTARFKKQGKEVNPRIVRFVHEMERTGELQGYLTDPFLVPIQYVRSAFSKIHMNDAFARAVNVVNDIRPGQAGYTEELEFVRLGLLDYIKQCYGQNPESYGMMREAFSEVFSNVGVKLEVRTVDKYINTLMSLNYGAFMGFRPALAVRNLTQTLMVTLPMLQDPVAFGKGIAKALSKEGREEAIRAGAVALRSSGAPMEDAIWKSQFYATMGEAVKNVGSWRGRFASRAVRGGIRVAKTGERWTALGLGSEKLSVGGKQVRIGFYSWADELNRVISYWSQRYKTEPVLNKFLRREINLAQFNEKSGLDLFGATHTHEFHRILREESKEAAVNYLGIQMANETQWVYQLGAGPAIISSGPARLLGQYGTWPSWYMAHMIRIARAAKHGGSSRKLAAYAMLWSGAAISGLGLATYKTGINFNRWSPLNSLTWSGGPMVDWMKDITEIWGGIGPKPSPGRALALGQRGIKDHGGNIVTQFDPRRGRGMDIEDPVELAMHVLEMFTPGSLFIQDMIDAANAPDMQNALIQAFGQAPVAGLSHPEITRWR